MILGLRILVIRVRDGERAIAFYRDGLGLPVQFAVEGVLTRFRLPDGTLLDLEIRPAVEPRPAHAKSFPAKLPVASLARSGAANTRCRTTQALVPTAHVLIGRMASREKSPQRK